MFAYSSFAFLLNLVFSFRQKFSGGWPRLETRLIDGLGSHSASFPDNRAKSFARQYTIKIYDGTLLASSKLGHCWLVMRNQLGALSQSETAKYFE